MAKVNDRNLKLIVWGVLTFDLAEPGSFLLGHLYWNYGNIGLRIFAAHLLMIIMYVPNLNILAVYVTVTNNYFFKVT